MLLLNETNQVIHVNHLISWAAIESMPCAIEFTAFIHQLWGMFGNYSVQKSVKMCKNVKVVKSIAHGDHKSSYMIFLLFSFFPLVLLIKMIGSLQ